MCCGGKKAPAAQMQSMQKANRAGRSIPQVIRADQVVMGAEGMTLLEYKLPKAGSVVYTGAVTQATYVFGGKRKFGMVDNRDVPALLARIEDRRHAFDYAKDITVIQPPAEKPAEPPSPMVTEPIKEEILPEPMKEEFTREDAKILLEAMKESHALKPTRRRKSA